MIRNLKPKSVRKREIEESIKLALEVYYKEYLADLAEKERKK